MSPKLKPLLLPQLVEERRKRQSSLEADIEFPLSSFSTQNSSASEIPSPVTPTFSARGHYRYSSSTSSIESLYGTASVSDSPSSPSFVAVKAGKRSLPDVQEEPQEREEDVDIFDDKYGLYTCLCDSQNCLHCQPTTAQSSIHLATARDFDFEMTDKFFSDGELSTSPRSKKRRADELTFNGFATRLGTRFPSFSRKWRSRKGASSASLTSDALGDTSRANSSRSSSVSNSMRLRMDTSLESPRTPAHSIFEEVSNPIDVEKANREVDAREEAFATTPLLPPLMIEASANSKAPLQSPLQSPSVAEPRDPYSGCATPIDSITTPQLPGGLSPALSTKHSVSSFHRITVNRQTPGHLVPSSEIPPILIADPNDEWANKLGHANFTIYPEPYLPEHPDLEACRQLRANWDLARCNYTKHLVRTGEHYGVTSATYKLTEEKWLSVDDTWRSNNGITIANAREIDSDAGQTQLVDLAAERSRNEMTKIPSLNDARCGGKFPSLGDEDIVGPMVQVPALIAGGGLRRSPSKKQKLMKFLTEKFPVSLGGRS